MFKTPRSRSRSATLPRNSNGSCCLSKPSLNARNGSFHRGSKSVADPLAQLTVCDSRKAHCQQVLPQCLVCWCWEMASTIGMHENMDCNRLASQQDVPDTFGNTPRRRKPAPAGCKTVTYYSPTQNTDPACRVAVGDVSRSVATLP